MVDSGCAQLVLLATSGSDSSESSPDDRKSSSSRTAGSVRGRDRCTGARGALGRYMSGAVQKSGFNMAGSVNALAPEKRTRFGARCITPASLSRRRVRRLLEPPFCWYALIMLGDGRGYARSTACGMGITVREMCALARACTQRSQHGRSSCAKRARMVFLQCIRGDTVTARRWGDSESGLPSSLSCHEVSSS